MALIINKRNVVVAAALSLSTLSFAQTSTPQKVRTPEGSAAQLNLETLANYGSLGVGNVMIFDNRYEGVRGNPYYFDYWLPGSVEIRIDNNGKTETFQGLQLKYDSFGNRLLAVIPQKQDTLQFSTSLLNSFRLHFPNGPIEFRRLKETQHLSAKYAQAFYAVLVEGKATLVKGSLKEKIDANFKGAYNAGQPYDQIVDETIYFILHNGQLEKVKLNKKSVLASLVNQQEKVKSYIEKEKLNMASEADVIRLLAYYNTL